MAMQGQDDAVPGAGGGGLAAGLQDLWGQGEDGAVGIGQGKRHDIEQELEVRVCFQRCVNPAPGRCRFPGLDALPLFSFSSGSS